MYHLEFYIFSFLVLTSALLSVWVKHTLYAVFCQLQAVIAVAGILAGLNAKFISFVLLFMSFSSLFVFLIFALIVFDFHKTQKMLPEKVSRLTLGFFVLMVLETVYLFFKPNWQVTLDLSDFSLNRLGYLLYAEYGFCVVLFATLLLSCMVGIATLLVRKETPLEQEVK